MKRILAAVVAAMMLLCAMPVCVGAVEAEYELSGEAEVCIFYSVSTNFNITSLSIYLRNNGDQPQAQYIGGNGYYFNEEDGKVYRKVDDGDPVYANIYVDEKGTLVLDGADILRLSVTPYVAELSTDEEEEKNPTVVVEVKGNNTLGDVCIDNADVVFTGEGKLDVAVDENAFSAGYYKEQSMDIFSIFKTFGSSVIVDGPEISINNTIAGSENPPASAGIMLWAYENYYDDSITPSALIVESGSADVVSGDADDYAYGITTSSLLEAVPMGVYTLDAASNNDPAAGHYADITVNGGKLTVTAGNAKTSNGIEVFRGDITVNGGKLTVTAGNAETSSGIEVFYGDITVNVGELHASSARANSFSEGICLEDGTLTVKSGAVLSAIGGETGKPLDVFGDHCSAGIDLSECKLIIEDGADVLAKGYDMAIIGLDSALVEPVKGEMAEKYDYTDTGVIKELADTLSTCFVALPDEDDSDFVVDEAFIKKITKYKYLHIYTPEPEDDAPAGFNLFALMLRMAQIDTKITGEGTVTHDGNNRMAYFHKPRTYTITPAEGWEIADVLYQGDSLGAVETVEIIPTARKSRLEVIFTEIPADDAE